MEIIRFITSLAGATMLLLFSVRLVRTGIERAHGASFQRLMSRQTSLVGAAGLGVGLAILLQSSAAVALLSSGFLVSGFLEFSIGLAIVLGGDLGSALVVQLLSFSVEWIIAPLLAIGGWLAVKSQNRRLRQYGRVIMGVALILVSLGFLRETVAPVHESSFLPAIANYLASDLLTAFIVGAVLAFVMHSSVAAVLVIATLIQTGAIPILAGLTLLAGINFGAGFIPVWLTRGMAAPARRLVLANLFVRGTLAVLILGLLVIFGSNLPPVSMSETQLLIAAHVGFNFLLLVLVLPFCRSIDGAMEQVLPGGPDSTERGEDIKNRISALNPDGIDNPTLAIASLKQELLHMLGLVETMFLKAFGNYEKGDPAQINAVREMDADVDACLSVIRSFVSAIPKKTYSKAEASAARDMLEFAVRLETAGDIAAFRFTALADELRRTGQAFSADGQSELVRMYDSILANFKLAANVLISDDPESARLLSLENTEMKRVERKSRKKHFKRLQSGVRQSHETSDVHLRTLRAFREINGHVSSVAYPILYESGQLLETKLIQEMPKKNAS